MRFAIAAAALCCSAPAFATGGFLCTSTGGEEPAISLVIGHGIPGGVVGAAIKETGAGYRVRNQGFGGTGTLVRNGRTYPVRCFQDG
jgi:hypothetical protein